MATPPTRVSYNVPASGNFSAAATSKVTAAFDVTAGDLIVVAASAEQHGTTTAVTPSASGGSVAWDAIRADQGAGTTQSGAWLWTGLVGATATGITITLARPFSLNLLWGFSATVWRNHGGVGTVFAGNNGTGSGAPAVAGAAACAANSGVQIQINDWNAADGTTRTWRTINGAAQAEATYFRASANHTVYGGYTLDTGAAGAVTQGLTVPSTMRYVGVGVEILAAGGGGGASTAPTRPRRMSPVPLIRASSF